MTTKERNIAFIDAQNLHLGTASEDWKIDFKRFRIYLKDKFHIEEAYFFLGFINDDHKEMYRKIQKAGFILEFRDHNSNMLGKKKGNVDVDIVFEVMHRLLEEDDFNKIVLVTGDGDYIQLVKYLIQKERLKRILFPNSKYSSLYKPFKDLYGMNLSEERVKNILKFIQ
ncbi:NYN domain-containing protein [Candidatus Gracilibacteria bacterium]|nr:NYN domain-containing protein [Candidatus Gracilibacteria bacterium]